MKTGQICNKNAIGFATKAFTYMNEYRIKGKGYPGCGCYLDAKIVSPNADYPLGKWYIINKINMDRLNQINKKLIETLDRKLSAFLNVNDNADKGYFTHCLISTFNRYDIKNCISLKEEYGNNFENSLFNYKNYGYYKDDDLIMLGYNTKEVQENFVIFVDEVIEILKKEEVDNYKISFFQVTNELLQYVGNYVLSFRIDYNKK